jgi:hypothetical protein
MQPHDQEKGGSYGNMLAGVSDLRCETGEFIG